MLSASLCLKVKATASFSKQDQDLNEVKQLILSIILYPEKKKHVAFFLDNSKIVMTLENDKA